MTSHQASSLHVGVPDCLDLDPVTPTREEPEKPGAEAAAKESLLEDICANLHVRFKKDHVYVSVMGLL